MNNKKLKSLCHYNYFLQVLCNSYRAYFCMLLIILKIIVIIYTCTCKTKDICNYFPQCLEKLVLALEEAADVAAAFGVAVARLQAIYLIKSRTRQKPSKKRLKRARFLHNCCNTDPFSTLCLLTRGIPLGAPPLPPFTCNCLSLNNVVSLLFSLSVLFPISLFPLFLGFHRRHFLVSTSK